MKHVYCWSWHEVYGQPINEMTEAKARRAWENGTHFGVVAGEDLTPRAVPAYFLAVSDHGDNLTVLRYSPAGSETTLIGLNKEGNRLFLTEISETDFPHDGKFHQGDYLEWRNCYFRPDGTAELRISRNSTYNPDFTEFTGIDVSTHWVDPITWGDWDRIGLYQPEFNRLGTSG